MTNPFENPEFQQFLKKSDDDDGAVHTQSELSEKKENPETKAEEIQNDDFEDDIEWTPDEEELEQKERRNEDPPADSPTSTAVQIEPVLIEPEKQEEQKIEVKQPEPTPVPIRKNPRSSLIQDNHHPKTVERLENQANDEPVTTEHPRRDKDTNSSLPLSSSLSSPKNKKSPMMMIHVKPSLLLRKSRAEFGIKMRMILKTKMIAYNNDDNHHHHPLAEYLKLCSNVMHSMSGLLFDLMSIISHCSQMKQQSQIIHFMWHFSRMTLFPFMDRYFHYSNHILYPILSKQQPYQLSAIPFTIPAQILNLIGSDKSGLINSPFTHLSYEQQKIRDMLDDLARFMVVFDHNNNNNDNQNGQPICVVNDEMIQSWKTLLSNLEKFIMIEKHIILFIIRVNHQRKKDEIVMKNKLKSNLSHSILSEIFNLSEFMLIYQLNHHPHTFFRSSSSMCSLLTKIVNNIGEKKFRKEFEQWYHLFYEPIHDCFGFITDTDEYVPNLDIIGTNNKEDDGNDDDEEEEGQNLFYRLNQILSDTKLNKKQSDYLGQFYEVNEMGLFITPNHKKKKSHCIVQ